MKIKLIIILGISAIFLFSCKPKEVNSGKFYLAEGSKKWIPFEGSDTVSFQKGDEVMEFISGSKTNYFDEVLYDSDQGAFFTKQEDYYAELERERLIFSGIDSTAFSIDYLLEKDINSIADWDMLRVSMYDENNYHIELRVAVNKSDDDYFGEQFIYHDTITIKDSLYENVLSWKQVSRPKELYITQTSGVIAYKFDSDTLWVIREE